MSSRLLLALCCLVLVLIVQTECRRNQTNSQIKRRLRSGRNRIAGGKLEPGIPHWLGSAWSQPSRVSQPSRYYAFADGNFHGLCINIGPRLIMAQSDAVSFFKDLAWSEPDDENSTRLMDYVTPTPEKIHVRDGASKGVKNSIYSVARSGPWHWNFYRRVDRKGVNVPFFTPPFPNYEAYKENFGDNKCRLYGYSESAKRGEQDERWFASADVRLVSRNCTDHICDFEMKGDNDSVCYGYHDVGAPILCGKDNKLTFITVFVEKERGGAGCHQNFKAYHVPFLYDSIKAAINSEKAKGTWDKQSDEEKFT